MRFAEAYKKLGYKLDNHQTDWSAEKADGVCISLWRSLLNRNPLYFDSFEVWPDEEPGANKIGHKKRTQHLKLAVEQFDRSVDVVLLNGVYGEGYEDAEPWGWRRRGGCWKITHFDEPTGKFRAEVVVQGKEGI